MPQKFRMSSSRGKMAVIPASKKRKGASGPTAELDEAIRPLLTTDPWELFFGIIEPTYLEITMEPCSTFHLQTVMTNYDDPGTVQFCLGGLVRQLSVPEFGKALGLYIVEFKEENDLHALNRHIHHFPSRCWDALVSGGATYNPSRSKASALPPSLRYLHTILAHTSTGGERALASPTLTTPTFYGHEDDQKALRNLPSSISSRPIYRGEAYEDIPDDVPPQHEDLLTQPPPSSRPVHAAASYADISERLTRFGLQCIQ
ncbi:hypothetical protein GOBAR_AA34879 [Gossypium barbadense]|uniref:Uncharacterized protein n=1 Tax=Gossypium barbadense TaxID=3634 RepID=A0A2P5W3Y6_GOSBA|nr:hypothetical protein GOBAR_AA34879 [Gossypium barbadense]